MLRLKQIVLCQDRGTELWTNSQIILKITQVIQSGIGLPKMFESLKTHFSSRQIVQIVSIIALIGFLNRWNDTMATALELPAAEFAASALVAVDGTVGKHGSN